jgi:hypothetical protein
MRLSSVCVLMLLCAVMLRAREAESQSCKTTVSERPVQERINTHIASSYCGAVRTLAVRFNCLWVQGKVQLSL